MSSNISINTEKTTRAIGLTKEALSAYQIAYRDVIVKLNKYESSIKDDISDQARTHLNEANKLIMEAIKRLTEMNGNLDITVDILTKFEEEGLKL